MYDCRVGIDGYFENIFVREGGRKIGRKEGRLGKSVEGEARPEEVSETSLMRF